MFAKDEDVIDSMKHKVLQGMQGQDKCEFNIGDFPGLNQTLLANAIDSIVENGEFRATVSGVILTVERNGIARKALASAMLGLAKALGGTGEPDK